MNIVSTYHPEDARFNGIISALAVVEERTIFWLPQFKPPFDMLDEVRPDLFICTSADFTPELALALTEYSHIDVIVFGLQHPQSITPRLLCTGDLPTQIRSNIQVPSISISSAANVAQYNNGTVLDKYASDVFYLSNIPVNNTQILSTIEFILTNKFRTKLCGKQPLPFPQYLGETGIKNATNLLVSSKIVLDFDRHVMLDAAFNKAFCISNVFTEFYPTYTSLKDLYAQLVHFLVDEKHRQVYIKKAYRYAKDNTYFHRLHDVCIKLGLTDLANVATTKLETIL